jgi:inorganic pyrophosphatase/exopolyphosphatase
LAILHEGPILFDTLNLSPTAGKTTEKDLLIYEQLRILRVSPIDDKKLYAALRRSAADTTGQNLISMD